MNENVALYKPISFVSEFHSMPNGLTSEILIKTSRNCQGRREQNEKQCMYVKFHENGLRID